MNVRRLRRTRPPQKSVVLMGLDPSLTSTGFAVMDASGEVHVGRLRSKFKGGQRLSHLIAQLRAVLDYYKPDAIFYEGYAFGAKGVGVFDRAELGGLFKMEAYNRGLNLALVSPTLLKRVATNKGNAKKPDMKRAMIDLFGVDSSCNDDEIDAYALLAMGQALLLGRGPQGFVNRAKASADKLGFFTGKGRNEVQTIAQLASVD